MAQLGADVEALERLSRKFHDESRNLERAIGEIDARLGETWWQGPDADRFRDAWSGDFSKQLWKVAKALDEAHVTTIRQANQQREASGA